MHNVAVLVWVYGTLVEAGGLIGWFKARSKPSLISGLVFGGLLWVCGVGVWLGQPWGVRVAAGLALVLTLVMSVRFGKTRKFMPAGLVTLVSVAVLLVLLKAMSAAG